MTPNDVAARLGVAAWQVTGMREHPAGHLVQLRGGRTYLVTATVARPYVPEVDDAAPAEQDAEPAPAKPRTRPKKG